MTDRNVHPTTFDPLRNLWPGAYLWLMLVAMATGTGKTFMVINEIYRLMKSGLARRILFLVDRRALAAQAVRALASFEPEGNKNHC